MRTFRKTECRCGCWFWLFGLLMVIFLCSINVSHIFVTQGTESASGLGDLANYITKMHNEMDELPSNGKQVRSTNKEQRFEYIVVSEKRLNIKNSTKISTKNSKKKMDPFSPRIHHSIGDHIYFMTYNGKKVFTNQDSTLGMTGRSPLLLERKMFEQVTQEALKYLDQQELRFDKNDCNYIRYRFIPTVGVEYDITCQNGEAQLSERVTLLQKFNASEVIFHQHQEQNKNISKVNIIMPLMGRPRTFSLFLKNIQLIQTQEKQRLGLTVVYFNDTHAEEISEILRNAQKETRGLEIHFILLKSQTFSRSKGLQVGAEMSKIKSETLFLSDVDIFFSKEFLHRCQINAVQGSQVYFPMLFSLFNPEFIYPLKGQKMPPPLDTLRIGDEHGYWRVWGHGMVCINKLDFMKIHGFNKRRKGWGGEDLSFLKATVKKKYKVIRALDPGLYHHYHFKNCADVGKGQRSSCRKVRAMSEASRTNLALSFFGQKLNTSVYGLMKDGSQPYDAEGLKETELHEESHINLIYSSLVLSLTFNMFLVYCIFMSRTSR